jgi:hypothetical protein
MQVAPQIYRYNISNLESQAMKIKGVSPILLATFLLLADVAFAAESMTVRIKDGRIQEQVNGSLRRTYGSGLVDVSTDGVTVVGVTKEGRIAEYRNGSLRRTFGSDAVRVRISGDSVFAELKNGRTAEYMNGSLRRIF